MHTHTHIHIYTYTHTHSYIYIHTHIHIYIYIHKHIHIYIHSHIHIYIYITTNLEHTPHAAPAPPLSTVKASIEKDIKIPYKRNIQGDDIMEKSFTHCTIDVMSLVILICNEKLLSSCPTKTNINKRDFSQT